MKRHPRSYSASNKKENSKTSAKNFFSYVSFDSPMSFCPGTYYTHIIDWIPDSPFQSTLDRLKSHGLEFAFGIDTDFSCPGHGRCIRDMLSGRGMSSCIFESVLSRLEKPYFALALMNASDEYVACLIAHWGPPSSSTPARVVIDLINMPETCISILFEVMETMIRYFWLTEEEGECFNDLKHLKSLEMICIRNMISEISLSTLKGLEYAQSFEDGEEMLVKLLVFPKLK